MSSSDAQRSLIHSATEDSASEPTGPDSQQRSAPSAGSADTGTRHDQGATGDVARQAADLKNDPHTAMGIPTNFERGAAMAGVHPDTDIGTDVPGAGNAASGGGAGAGTSDGDTDPGTDRASDTGTVAADRNRLFPDATQGLPHPGAFNDDTKIGSDPDESSYGGPLNLDVPNAD